MDTSHDVVDRPIKLRRDAVYLKIEDGIFFRSAFGDFTLKGRTIYNSFSKLLPHLDGSVSERNLLGSVQSAQRPATEALLRLLIDREIVRRIDPADGALLNPAVADYFQAQIDYLGHSVEDPARRFLAFRNARILLVGDGESFLGAGLSLLSNGLAELDLASTDRAMLDDPAWARTCGQLAARRLEPKLNRHDPAQAETRAFDLVVYCSQRPDLSAIDALVRDCATNLLPAFVLDGHSYVGPASAPDAAGCWLCAMMRRSARIAPEKSRGFWEALALGRRLTPLPVSGVAAQMLGSSVALEAYKSLVGTPKSETGSQLLDQDLATMETSIRQFLAHPDCPRCAGLARDSAAEPVTHRLEAQAGIACWTPYMGHDFASFGGFDDAEIEQVPISLTALSVSPLERIFGWSIKDALHARSEALSEAIRRQFIRGDGAHLARSCHVSTTDVVRVSPARIAGWLGNGDEGDRLSVRGYGITEHAAYEVPIAALHPALDAAGHYDPSHAGLGVGLSREEAVDRAVLDLFEHELVSALAEGALPVWDAAGQLADGTTKYLLSIIASLGAHPPRLGIVRHIAGISAALALPDGEQAAAAGAIDIACDLSPVAAINRLLERSVARLQVERNGLSWETRRRPGAFAEIPLDLPPLEALPPEFPAVHDDMSALAAKLAGTGAALVACDVTPPDVRATQSYVVVKALLLKPIDPS